MDAELKTATALLQNALLVMRHRKSRLETTTTKLSRHYNRLRHTSVLISMIEEIQGVVQQDPDMWDDEPDLVPF